MRNGAIVEIRGTAKIRFLCTARERRKRFILVG